MKKVLMQKKFQKAGLIKMNDLKLNKELYKYEDIILVTKVFSHLALIEVEEDNNYWKCRFKNCRYIIQNRQSWNLKIILLII